VSILVNDLLRNYYKDIDVEAKLDLDWAIKQLRKENELDYNDLLLIKLLKRQCSILEMRRSLRCSVRTTHRKKQIVCSKIANKLGAEYQDYIIILKVQRRLERSLTDEERLFCWLVINKFGRFDKRINIFNFKERVELDGFRGDQKEG
jgi:hypothetical protein